MTEPAVAQNPDTLMRSVLQRIATGPEYSKDIPREEARAALNLILEDQADPVQAGIYLIALRMKRETLDENAGSLDALLDHTVRVTADVDQVVDLAEPYDGFVRGLPMAVFLPAVLAACGTPTVCHSSEPVGPKFGLTARQILRSCGGAVDRPPADVAARLAAAECGWGYVDQSQFCPPLARLKELRTRIVKRPVLTTVEVLLGPILGRKKTHLITGYVHKPYPPIYTHLAQCAGFDSALIVRGVEGGIIPSLTQSGRAFGFYGTADGTEWNFHPEQLHLTHNTRTVSMPDTEEKAEAAIAEGRGALNGQTGAAYDCLLYAACMILAHLDQSRELSRHADTVRRALDSGEARARFEAGLS